MKADACGTYTEQIRAKMGWKSPAQLKGSTAIPRCSECKHFHLKRIVKADESVDFSAYCRHVRAGGEDGHATRATAHCDEWGRRE